MKSLTTFFADHLVIWITIFFTVTGQLILKWRSEHINFDFTGIRDVGNLLVPLKDVWVLIAYGMALLASVSWLLALRRFELTYAFPFAAISYVLILAIGGMVFNEPITLYKVAGCSLIMIGIATSVQS